MTLYHGNIEDTLENEKRLYADIQVEAICPKCGITVTHDFNDDYISYGELKEINFYCYEGCNQEWSLPARIVSAELTIEVDEKKP